MAKDGDIFGDGVNIAARLQALAGAGGICVSRGVRDQIRHIGAYPDGSLALLAKAMLEELRPTSSGWPLARAVAAALDARPRPANMRRDAGA